MKRFAIATLVVSNLAGWSSTGPMATPSQAATGVTPSRQTC